MGKSIPDVSVLMTAYNREQYIGQALESVLCSTFSDFELIVVDDRSSDRTADVVREYQSRDPRIRLFCNDENLGDYPNRNRAAGHARGEYLEYVDSDDVIYPHGLEVMVRCMNAYPEAGLGLSALPDPDGPCPRFLTPLEAYRENFFEHDLLGRAPGSAIIRRSAFNAVGGFSGRRYVGDHELWLKMARRFGLVKMPTDLLWDRLHGEQEKHSGRAFEQTVLHENVEIEALWADDCPFDDRERAIARARLARNRARNYWLLVGSGGLGVANEYRKAAAMSAASVAKFAWERLIRVSSPFRPRSTKGL